MLSSHRRADLAVAFATCLSSLLLGQNPAASAATGAYLNALIVHLSALKDHSRELNSESRQTRHEALRANAQEERNPLVH